MFTRRQFLVASGGLGLTALVPQKLWGMTGSLFPLGVACGDPEATQAVLWTRYLGKNRLRVCVWSEKDAPMWWDVSPLEGGYVVLEIAGLSSDTAYLYAFVEFDACGQRQAQSPVGRFKTALGADDLRSVRFGAVSCIKYVYEPSLLDRASQQAFDFFVFNGDNSYNDGCFSKAQFRERWSQTLSWRAHQKLRQSFGLISTLDDHDIENNFDMDTVSHAKFQNGLEAYFEHMPTKRSIENPNRLWRKRSWGKTLDLFVLDCRTERYPSQQQYISPEQMQWLKQELANSQAMFKVILNSVPITEYPSWFLMAHDRWQGYPAQRAEILSHIDQLGISNVLWLSGDFHFTSQQRVSASGLGSNQMEVLAGPGAQISNRAGHPLKVYSQFDWVHVANSYLAIDCDVKTQKIRIEPHF